MDSGFEIKVVTPSGTALTDRTSSVTLATSNGEIGVLERHCMYTGVLGRGPLRFKSLITNEKVEVIVDGGFCSFGDNTLLVLADNIDAVSESNPRANPA